MRLIDADELKEKMRGLEGALEYIDAAPTVDAVIRDAVIDRLYDWSNHSATQAETWHLRQVIGDIKSWV